MNKTICFYSGFYGDYAVFMNSTISWTIYGGLWHAAVNTGEFAMGAVAGNVDWTVGSRLELKTISVNGFKL